MAMKRLAGAIFILAAAIGSASGADMALKAPPPPVAPTWTGFYFGANAGPGVMRRDYFEKVLAAALMNGLPGADLAMIEVLKSSTRR